MDRWSPRIGSFAVLALLLAACASTTPAPTPDWNDDFADRFVLVGASGSAEGANDGATIQAGEPFALRSWNGSVWWTWTAPTSGAYAFDTVGSDFDTVLGIYTGGSLGSLVVVGENDDAVSLQSRVAFEAVAGTAYQIAVGNFGFSFGSIVLNWGPVAN